LPFGSIVFRVPDVEATKEKLRGEGVEFQGETWTRASATARRSSTRTGTASRSHRRYAPYPTGRALMDVEHVDFVSFLTQDIRRAKQFYSERPRARARDRGRERHGVPAGQVTLDIFDPSSIGQPFAPTPAGHGAARRRRRRRRAELEAKGVVFDGETIETSVCQQAWFKDPDGNALMLHRRYDV
jgi:catechol 2,3-dioxygenase-like lactoylglutathione lyase family enzyme